ncbi:hypothetical protein PM082_018183 [Marasmius tenuissimus]|nr:hypothetical protein PM082_018183 [Marasmius tenuissimus]
MPDTPLPASSASPKTPIGPEDFPAKTHGVDVQYDGLSIYEGVPPTRPLKGKLCAHGAPQAALGPRIPNTGSIPLQELQCCHTIVEDIAQLSELPRCQ